MDNLDLLKLLGVLLSAPYWWPLLKTLFQEVQEHSSGEAPPPAPAKAPARAPSWSGDRLEESVFFNARWGAGRNGPASRGTGGARRTG